ncbi:hypothetical protein V6N13_007987 [Hibiscus sabdariffa]
MSLPNTPLGPPSVIDLVNPGGRPPDAIVVIPGVPARERSTSPSQLDRIHLVKKGRADDSVDVDVTDSEMVAGVGKVPVRKV